MSRRLAGGAILLLLGAFLLTTRTFSTFDPVRIKVVRSPQPASGDVTLALSPELRIETLPRPFAVIWIVRNGSAQDATFTLALDGSPVCQDQVRAGQRQRIDCATAPDFTRTPPARLSITGPAGWSLEYLELASHHGRASQLFVLPDTSHAYGGPSLVWLLVVPVLAGLLGLVPPRPLRRRWLRRLYLAAAGVVTAIAVVVALAPWVSSFKVVVPLGFWLGAAAILLIPRLRSVLSPSGRLAPVLRWTQTRLSRGALAAGAHAKRHHSAVTRAAVAGLAISLAVVGVLFGVKTAGGSDPFGYVSQAYLWLERTLIVPYPAISLIGVPHPEAFLNTLGYAPGLSPGTMVPTYPPGLAIVMAAFLAVFGTWGPFLVVPASAALLIVATFALGRRFEDASVGLLAAALVAFSPAVVFQSLWPMSDVPVAAVWTLSLAVAAGAGRGVPLVAGALAGLAILIRPNLAPLALIGALFLWRSRRGDVRAWFVRLVLYGLAAVPFVVLVGWFNAHLYGSPFSSGYGDVRALYAWKFIGPNVVNYSSWFFTSHGPFVAALALYGWARALADRSLRPLAIFVAAVVACYLPYLVFEAWWYLRFLLPAYPALFVVTASAGVALLRRATPRIRRAAVVAGLLLAIGHPIWFLQRENPFGLHKAEHRYAAIGAYVRAALPQNAAFLTMQHSGALRYYSGRLSVRYDWVAPGWLSAARAALEEAGYVVYVLIDETEEKDLRKRFTAPGEAAFLDQPPVAELLSVPPVRVYALSDDMPVSETEYVPSGRGMPVPPVHRKAVAWEPPASGR